jgi:23S rRNA (cytosine1962-C5)-methyltransferase
VSAADELALALRRAIDRRAAWLADLRGTDCVRLLAGAVEGAPGVTVDRYGEWLLVQTGRELLPAGALEVLQRAVEDALGGSLTPVWNHRPAYRREGFAHHHRPERATEGSIGHEEGLRFRVDPRHGGQDPLLFLDLRAGRRRVRQLAEGRRVLNLFAYTCGLGVAAMAGHAREVVNVDFARSALSFGAENALLNGMGGPIFRLVHEDVIPVVRQLAGLPLKGRGARRAHLEVHASQFDLVALDPPRWAKTPYGAVDVVRDYPSLLKPAVLCLAPGGVLLATNHVPSVSTEDFVATATRTAEKVGRRLVDVEVLGPDPDFPAVEGRAPLRILVARVA